ncbi:MAG TPA: TRAM domain-containing protein [Armatimonadota bacterium]|nr:TRAM domain-containing protein [Armatimonadota bacterium]
MVTRYLSWAFLILFSIIGGILGKAAGDIYFRIGAVRRLMGTSELYSITATIAFIALGVIMTSYLSQVINRQVMLLSNNLEKLSTAEKLEVLIGVVVGITVATIMVYPWPLSATIKVCVWMVAGTAFAYLGARLFLSMKEDIFLILPSGSGLAKAQAQQDQGEKPRERIKILDTNVIIDGRISDVCRTGFVEGPIYVPGCVLEELHHIADSTEPLKRARGRRGLDILQQMQKDMHLLVRTYDHLPLEGNGEVDYQLVQLAKKLDGAIITNDFNLNKVAELEGVTVLNVNELANALKPVVLPGEEMSVTLIREGKEINQGVAYLEDGTMVVVEGGRRHIGETLDVTVTSVLQTVAGKMIFAEVKSANGGEEGGSNMRSGSAGGGQRRKSRQSVQ